MSSLLDIKITNDKIYIDIKNNSYSLFNRQIYWLKKLSNYQYFPNIVNIDDKENTIICDFKSGPIKKIREQIEEIREILKTNNCQLNNLNEKETNNLLSTLCEFTILTIEKSLNFFPKLPKTMIYSGGGVNNLYLINKLKKIINIKDINLKHKKISTDFIEAELIAYLTARSLHKLPLTFPNTTGVSKPLSGGLIYNPRETH